MRCVSRFEIEAHRFAGGGTLVVEPGLR